MINVTAKAVDKIREQFAKHGVQGGLRLGVLGGGCSGLSYLFKFDVKPRPTDQVYEFKGVKVFVEVGPGNVLSNMLPFIDRTAAIRTASDLLDQKT